MGRCVERIVHEKCGKNSLQVFQQEDGSYDGYCYSCGHVVSNPYHDKPDDYKPQVYVKSKEEIQAELDEIRDCSSADLPNRSLKKIHLDYFGIKIGLSPQDGTTPDSYYFPYYDEDELKGYKAGLIKPKADGKKMMWAIGSTKDVDLFGWKQAIATGAKRLYITEGEFDAVALWAIIMRCQHGTQYEDNIPAVVSLPHGIKSAHKDISRMAEKIRRHFPEVILVFDTDDAGRQGEEEVLKNYPDFMSVELPQKDANECLKKGNIKATFNKVTFQATRPKNTRLVWGGDLIEAGRQEAEWGLSWPWQSVTDLTRGIRFGETIYIGSGVKMGKSEVVNALGSHLILEHGLKILMAKPEEANRKTFQMVVGKAAGKIFHDPKIPFDYQAYDQWAPRVAEQLCMLNLYQHLGWSTLEADIRLAAASGCKAVFIDPITNLTNGMASGDANVKLQGIAQELAAMAKDLDIVIFIFCHLKAPTDGKPSHERGGEILSSQFAGSRAMMRSCNYMFGLEGNKDPELPLQERNQRTLVLLEDREFGNVGRVNLWWNDKTSLFTEM